MSVKALRNQLLGAIAMVLVAAIALGSSTFAWFAMNTTVEVNGMKVQAQSEKGLLINEKQGNTSSDGTWAEVALGGQTSAISLRPASTSDLTNWWHANSKKSNDEAGYNGTDGVDADKTVAISSGVYYSDIKPEATGILTNVTNATADANAKRTVYYSNGTGASENYDDGEGYYIVYEYYLKSSSNTTMSVSADKLEAKVTAAKLGSGSVNELDRALRVGVMIGSDTKIFAPIENFTTPYGVAGSTAGATYTSVAPIAGDTFEGINTSALDLPAVTANGLLVKVFVWFEGEDAHCKSDNITATLNSYEITVQFKDADLA